MKWSKAGNIFTVENRSEEWAKSHAQCPVVDSTHPGEWFVYFSTRDAENKSRIGRFVFDPVNPQKSLSSKIERVLDLGKRGCFDDAGVMPSCLLDWNGKKYLYYIGWTERVSVPYHNSIGLAVSEDNGLTFKRAFEGPLFPPLKDEPYFTGTISVLPWNNRLIAYYLSCEGWIEDQGHQEPIYNLKYATSKNGVDWDRQNQVAVDFKSPDEGGLASAAPVKIGDQFHMWFCYRGRRDYRKNSKNTYRIGYAHSQDALKWHRDDAKSGITISPEGWDSEMICYPYLANVDNNLYLFYNGNGFGKTGIGYATMKLSDVRI